MGLIPFDVEKAKQGAKLIFVWGGDRYHDFPVVITYGASSKSESVMELPLNGRWKPYALYIEEPERWINVYQNNGSGHEWSSDTYPSKEEAEKHAKMFLNNNCRLTHVGTFKLVEE
jgi:hypothetical protein